MAKGTPRLVLVVEDDLSVRQSLVKFLELHGFTVVTAETGAQGVEVIGKQRVVAGVIDLRLREGSGREVVEAMPPDIPVIIFSGVPSESGALEQLRPNTQMIEKPVSLVLLVQTLEHMLARAASLRSPAV